ncbi:MAG: hypothetical protein KJ734_02985, partial [Chloroflexi bacterium]|nr:hypothetical protein [Chloroflexota bacterium]
MAVEFGNVSYEILSISGGQMRDRVPHASMYQPTTRLGRRPARDPIYTLVNVTGGGRSDLAQDVISVVEEEYANHPSRSITSALISAIKAANAVLYQENLE